MSEIIGLRDVILLYLASIILWAVEQISTKFRYDTFQSMQLYGNIFLSLSQMMLMVSVGFTLFWYFMRDNKIGN